MLKRWFAATLLLGLAPLPALGSEPDEARAWLERMVEAVQGLAYEGRFVYIHGEHVEAMEIVHRRGDEGEQVRLVSLNGAAREILRDDDAVTCILPDSRTVLVEERRARSYLPEGLLRLREGLERHYEFVLAGEDRMTGRMAQVIAVQPRDAYRYGYRLWLDRETGMLLKSDLLDESGTAVEQMMFTSLELRQDIPAERLQPSTSGRGYEWLRVPARDAGTSTPAQSWSVGSLPPGFRMAMRTEHGMATSRMPVEHLVYTDGLASVSVYVERSEDSSEMLDGPSRMGAVSAFGLEVDGHQVTVVGEVPERTVELIARAVRHRAAGDAP